ncbi:DUF7269 family protein [Halovenus aranensis]|nr:hypothetical protein [Halovenus aranensis]
MRPRRTLVGIGLFVCAVAVMFAPQFGIDLPIARQLTVILGAAVVGAGALYIRGESRTAADIPATEGPASLPTPGDEVEDQLATLSRRPFRPEEKRRWKETHDDLRDRLRPLALATLTERYNLTEAEANDLLESGAWSENDRAVAFFTDDDGNDAPSLVPWRDGGATAGEQASHVIDELGAIERGDQLLPEGALSTGVDETEQQERGESA